MSNGQMLLVLVQNQLAMNLVADQQQVLLFNEPSEGLQLTEAVATASRVLRIGNTHHLGLRAKRIVHACKVHRP